MAIEVSTGLFDISSPLFKTTLLYCSYALATAVSAGVIWEIWHCRSEEQVKHSQRSGSWILYGAAQDSKIVCIDNLACEQALLFGRAKRVSRERASEQRSSEGQRKGALATISHKISFVLRPDEGKYNWLKNDVPKNKVD